MVADHHIRSYEQFTQSLRCFESWLGDAAPGATDIDVLIERRGQFLIFEAKTMGSNGIQVPMGQAIALDALAKLATHTVYLIGEGPKGGKHIIQWTPGLGQRSRGPRFIQQDWMRRVTNAQLQELVRDWWGD